MSKFLLLFGTTPALSQLELRLLAPELEWQVIKTGELKERLAFLEADDSFDPQKIIAQTAGLVKIFRLEKTLAKDSDLEALKTAVAKTVSAQAERPYFGVYQKGRGQKAISNGKIKAMLKAKGISSRYFTASLDASALSLHHQDAQEIFLYHDEEQIYLSRLVAMQDIDDWTKRDRSKPYFDRKKGMLPPKVARMMLNIALGQWLKDNPNKQAQDARLYDPFCGTGTVLAEALAAGCQIYGSDLDEQAIWGSQENLNWFVQEYNLPAQDFKKQIFLSDVGQLNPANFPEKIDLLVTEPFLGRQTPKEKDLANIFKGLEKMYLGAFKNFSKILNPGAKIVIIFPKVQAEQKTYSLKKLIDKLALKGYNPFVESLTYARSGARVQREIYCFTYEGKKEER